MSLENLVVAVNVVLDMFSRGHRTPRFAADISRRHYTRERPHANLLSVLTTGNRRPLRPLTATWLARGPLLERIDLLAGLNGAIAGLVGDHRQPTKTITARLHVGGPRPADLQPADRLSNRIGRVDRIDGRPQVQVSNFFYVGTVKEDIDRRIRHKP